MTEDEWQAHVTHEAAKAIGQWLETRGKLHQSIHQLIMPELQGMAAAAISRYAALRAVRERARSEATPDPSLLYAG